MNRRKKLKSSNNECCFFNLSQSHMIRSILCPNHLLLIFAKTDAFNKTKHTKIFSWKIYISKLRKPYRFPNKLSTPTQKNTILQNYPEIYKQHKSSHSPRNKRPKLKSTKSHTKLIYNNAWLKRKHTHNQENGVVGYASYPSFLLGLYVIPLYVAVTFMKHIT